MTGVATPILRAIGFARTPEADLDAMERQRETLNSRLLTATAQADEARTRQRDLLLADPIDETALAEAEDMARVADGRLKAVQEAIAALVDRITAARASLDAEADRTERERIAADYEARADRIAAAAVQLDNMAMKLDDLRKTLVATVVEDMILPPDPTGYSQFSRPEMPMIAGAARLAGFSESGPESAYGAAHSYVEGLRRLAADTRNGALPAVMLPKLYREVAAEVAPLIRPVPMTRVVLSRPVAYVIAGGGGTAFTISGDIEVPVVVANAARKAGIGFEPGSADGRAIQAALRRSGDMALILKRESGMWLPDKGNPKKPGGPLVTPESYLDLGTFQP